MFSVIIPTLNERAHISDLVAGVLAGAGPGLLEVIVADGGSTDGTRDIVAGLAAQDGRVRLLANPRRLQAAGINLAAGQADPRATVLVRLDAHAHYPAGYADRAAMALEAQGADSVVVRLLSHGQGCFQRAAAAAGNSVLGTGGSVHRMGGPSRWIDHGHHAAFRRDRFQALGGYDESFPANEDAEYDARLRQAGGRIWFDAGLEVTYFPRRTPMALARQYWRYGVGRASTFRKHGKRLRARQLVAPALVVAMTLAVLLAPLARWTLLLPAAYIALCLGVGTALAARRRDRCMLAVAIALPCMHLPWGVGFLLTLARARRTRSRADHGS